MGVLERLTDLFIRRGVTDHIRSDDGGDSTAEVMRPWQVKVGVRPLLIDSASLLKNGCCESFNGKVQDEPLNREILYTLLGARVLIERWRNHYNRDRPHTALGYHPPAAEAIFRTAVADVARGALPRDTASSTPPKSGRANLNRTD